MVNPLIDSIGTHFWENRYRSPAKIKNLTLGEENPRQEEKKDIKNLVQILSSPCSGAP
jgi:hypothetical protein